MKIYEKWEKAFKNRPIVLVNSQSRLNPQNRPIVEMFSFITLSAKKKMKEKTETAKDSITLREKYHFICLFVSYFLQKG